MVAPRTLHVLALFVGVAAALLAGTLAGFAYALTWNVQDRTEPDALIGPLVAAAVIGGAGALAAPFRPALGRWPLLAAAGCALLTVLLTQKLTPGTPALGFGAAAWFVWPRGR